MRKPRNRRAIRKSRKYDKITCTISANKIQNFCKDYLKRRYRNICINHDDDDIFTFEPVYMIPRGLLITVEKHGFNALNLLLWIMRSDKEYQVHPITRNKFDETVEIQAIYQIALFLRNDSKNFRQKKGYYKRRNNPTRVLTKYAKTIML